jgi:hypothetical protein
MTLLTLLTMSKLRIYARTLLQPLDETMSTLSTMSECQRHRCRPSHRPSRPLNVNALTWLAAAPRSRTCRAAAALAGPVSRHVPHRGCAASYVLSSDTVPPTALRVKTRSIIIPTSDPLDPSSRDDLMAFRSYVTLTACIVGEHDAQAATTSGRYPPGLPHSIWKAVEVLQAAHPAVGGWRRNDQSEELEVPRNIHSASSPRAEYLCSGVPDLCCNRIHATDGRSRKRTQCWNDRTARFKRRHLLVGKASRYKGRSELVFFSGLNFVVGSHSMLRRPAAGLGRRYELLRADVWRTNVTNINGNVTAPERKFCTLSFVNITGNVAWRVTQRSLCRPTRSCLRWAAISNPKTASRFCFNAM